MSAPRGGQKISPGRVFLASHPAPSRGGAPPTYGGGGPSRPPPGSLEGRRHPIMREGSTITTATQLSSIRDFGVEIGGPILRDRLWFYAGISPSFLTYRAERQLNIIRFANGAPVVEGGFTQNDP